MNKLSGNVGKAKVISNAWDGRIVKNRKNGIVIVKEKKKSNAGLKRVYVYEEDYFAIQYWAVKYHCLGPNDKVNFPYSLAQYIKFLKEK